MEFPRRNKRYRLPFMQETERCRASLSSWSFSLSLVLILPEASHQIFERRGALAFITLLIDVHEVELLVTVRYLNVFTPLL
jgi:hypothetical protein